MTIPAPGSATLVATDLCVARGGRTVLSGISLTVTPTSRIGVIGPNGVGKTTLLSVLAGRVAPDSGSVRLDPPGATVGLLAQHHEAQQGETVRQLLTRQTGVAGAESELSAAANELARGTPGAEGRYTEALDRLTALAGGDLDARIESVLMELGVPKVPERPVGELSGGQASKVALGALMLSRFDVTLLDEPTNDLDFEGLDLLGSFIARRPGGMVVVSHDRDFLDRTVTSVLEIDERDHTGRFFSGGWSAYLAERATLRRHAEETYALNQAQRGELTARAQREREWATKGVRREKAAQTDGDKAQRAFRVNRTEQLASRARRTERALRSLQQVDKPWEGWQLRFSIERAPRAGAVVARLEHAVVERGAFHLGPIDLQIDWGERVALAGANGAGKSSLVAAVVGRLPLAAGTRWLGPSVVIGELGQDRSGFGTSAPVVDALIARSGLGRSEARSLLAKFGLGTHEVERPSSSLSPGERTRAELATFQASGVNFLVLDEPTNHLDLPAIEQLEAALAAYDGTLLLVTHDRRLIQTVELTRTIELERSH